MSAVIRKPLPPRWQERIALRDGRALWLRPLVPEDAAALQAGFMLLTAQEVRMRFLRPLKALSPELLHRLTHPDPRRELALVAAEPLPPGEALVGAVARAAIDADGRRAEFAILVGRLLASQGLGRLRGGDGLGRARGRNARRRASTRARAADRRSSHARR